MLLFAISEEKVAFRVFHVRRLAVDVKTGWLWGRKFVFSQQGLRCGSENVCFHTQKMFLCEKMCVFTNETRLCTPAAVQTGPSQIGHFYR